MIIVCSRCDCEGKQCCVAGSKSAQLLKRQRSALPCACSSVFDYGVP